MTLKVFDLQCAEGHLFEGWFGSHDDYDQQLARGLITCPICQSGDIQKKLSAPRLNLGHYSAHNPTGTSDLAATASAHQMQNNALVTTSQDKTAMSALPDTQEMYRLQAAMMARLRAVIQSTENVGVRFAQEARAIHEGEAAERAIRGTATPEERHALAEDGITVIAVPDFMDTSKMQ